MYSNDFVIEGSVLVKYNGKDTIVAIPYGVTKINSSAFCDCDFLKEIIIPESVLGIGEKVFSGCFSLKKIYAPTGLDLNSAGYAKDCEIIRRK